MLVPLLISKPPVAAPGPEDYFATSEIARADAYAALRVPISLGATALASIVVIVFAVGPGARAFGAWASRVTGGRWWASAGLLSASVSIAPTIAILPLLVVRHAQDRDFGLATNSTQSMLTDIARNAAISGLLTLVAGVGFVAMGRRLKRSWPLVTATAAAGMLLAMVWLYPVVYEPMFNKFESVGEPTRGRIMTLADDIGVPVSDVLVADASRRTARHNAYVSGIGSTRRVVLYDTLLQEAPAEEVDLVVAHELSHVSYNDVRNGTMLGVVGAVSGVFVLAMLISSPWVKRKTGAEGAGDPRIVPFVVAFVTVAGLLTLPLQNLLSRSVEARADRFAVARTGSVETAVSLEQRLALTNLADLTPNKVLHLIFGTHPTTMERIGIALDAAGRTRVADGS